jgi:hypothetical protein
MTKFGQLNKLKITYYVIGPRSAWDTVEIGPFRTQEQCKQFIAKDFLLAYYQPNIAALSAEGYEALKVMELLEEQSL